MSFQRKVLIENNIVVPAVRHLCRVNKTVISLKVRPKYDECTKTENIVKHLELDSLSGV